MSINVTTSHDEQVIEVWHDDGMQTLTLPEADQLIAGLKRAIDAILDRSNPPAPAPFCLDGGDKEFADTNECSGQMAENCMHCGGGVAGHEFYLMHFFALRNWLNDVLDYHRKEGCLNLKRLEGKADGPRPDYTE